MSPVAEVHRATYVRAIISGNARCLILLDLKNDLYPLSEGPSLLHDAYARMCASTKIY